MFRVEKSDQRAAIGGIGNVQCFADDVSVLNEFGDGFVGFLLWSPTTTALPPCSSTSRATAFPIPLVSPITNQLLTAKSRFHPPSNTPSSDRTFRVRLSKELCRVENRIKPFPLV